MSARKVSQMHCQACGMLVEPVAAYHPHLFCVLYGAYKRNPADVLTEHGYERRADVLAAGVQAIGAGR